MKIAQGLYEKGLPVIGVPKTIDNDLPITDNCPGFGSVAKYVAVSTQEAALDVVSMAKTSTKVFVLEVMGRHAGWIAAAVVTGAYLVLAWRISGWRSPALLRHLLRLRRRLAGGSRSYPPTRAHTSLPPRNDTR